MNYCVLALVVVTLFAYAHSASMSQSCSWGPDGVPRCLTSNDPRGNSAGAVAGSNGYGGQIFTGAGGPGGWNSNFGQFGFPGNVFPFGQQLPQLQYYGRR